MISFRICASLVLLLACVEQGSAQTIPCSTELGCVSTATTLVDSIRECCSTFGGQTYRPSETSETCQLCYLYGWVQNIAADQRSAEPQEDIPLAVEGQEIALNIYFRNNFPPNDAGFLFTIETGGTAVEGTDYTISHPEPLLLVSEPVPVTVSLLNDREAGEDFETIILTLRQDEDVTPSNLDQILSYPTVQITIQDNDLETGFSVSELTVPESNEQVEVCLSTEGTPASDTILSVTLIPGTAGEDDFNLVTEQVVITTDVTAETCVNFIALADSLGLEGQETLSLMLSGPENVQFGNATLSITINDADESSSVENTNSSDTSTSNNTTSVIGGVVAAVVIGIIIAITVTIIIIIFVKHRQGKGNKSVGQFGMEGTNDVPINADPPNQQGRV